MAYERPTSRPNSRTSSFHSQEEVNGQIHARTPPGSAKSKRQGGRSLDLNESSPLLSPLLSPQRLQSDRDIDDHDTPAGLLDWNDGEEEEKSKSVFYLFILTLSIGGLQIAWATELSNGSPYLLSLGMSKSLLAFVWIAGPLTGVLVQPYVGIRSDNSRSKWGKRIPFMLSGAFATAIAFIALAWAREIVHGFLGLFGADPMSHGVQVCTIIWATIFVYILDFAINAVQAGIRAFIVDNAPTHQQEEANAWASRITGVGNILAFVSGYVNLPEIFPWLGRTQFQVLSAIAGFSLCSTVLISSLYIRERDPRLEGPPPNANLGVLAFFRQVFNATLRLPPQIRKVCEAQFFAWMGWFGFLFYMTTYIGQLYVNPYFAAHRDLTPDEIEKEWEEATRIGTFAFLIYAVVSFSANIFLPFFIVPSYRAPDNDIKTPSSGHQHTPGTPGHLSASMSTYFPPHSSPSANLHARLSRLLNLVQIQWLTLRRAWFSSQIFFALCMFITFFIRTPNQATVLTGFVGIPWALSLWAPFALISAEISKRDSDARREGIRNRGRNNNIQGEGGVVGRHEDQAGVILGLHNVAVSAPQIVATLVSSLIFKLAQKPRGVPYDDSVGWVLRFGGLAALAAAFFIWRIDEEAEVAKTYHKIGKGIADGASAEEGQRLRNEEAV